MPYNIPEENQYDDKTTNYTPETIPQAEIIRRAIRDALIKTRVMVPAVITKVLGNQKVNIQILLKSRYTNNQVVDIPELQNVMVSMPMGEDWSIKLPIAVGDVGYALFCDRSLDLWSSGDGSAVDPADTRAHDLSDAVFVPGLAPFSEQTEDNTTDMILTNGEAVLRIEKSGKFKLTNGTNELIDVIDQLMNTLINNTFTLTESGPQPFIASTITALQQIQQALETLKGS